jgi:hypothetical protein
MIGRLKRSIALPLACALALAVSGCAGWQGASDVSTDVGGGALGHGPGLFTGKRGAIVIYEGPWPGASPSGGAE